MWLSSSFVIYTAVEHMLTYPIRIPWSCKFVHGIWVQFPSSLWSVVHLCRALSNGKGPLACSSFTQNARKNCM